MSDQDRAAWLAVASLAVTWMQQAATHAPEAGQALLVTFFQVAIAFSAFIGGIVVDARGIGSALLLGSVLALLSAGSIGFGKAPADVERRLF
jgi:predicted MFS family arabinose efflux permease